MTHFRYFSKILSFSKERPNCLQKEHGGLASPRTAFISTNFDPSQKRKPHHTLFGQDRLMPGETRKQRVDMKNASSKTALDLTTTLETNSICFTQEKPKKTHQHASVIFYDWQIRLKLSFYSNEKILLTMNEEIRSGTRVYVPTNAGLIKAKDTPHFLSLCQMMTIHSQKSIQALAHKNRINQSVFYAGYSFSIHTIQNNSPYTHATFTVPKECTQTDITALLELLKEDATNTPITFKFQQTQCLRHPFILPLIPPQCSVEFISIDLNNLMFHPDQNKSSLQEICIETCLNIDRFFEDVNLKNVSILRIKKQSFQDINLTIQNGLNTITGLRELHLEAVFSNDSSTLGSIQIDTSTLQTFTLVNSVFYSQDQVKVLINSLHMISTLKLSCLQFFQDNPDTHFTFESLSKLTDLELNFCGYINGPSLLNIRTLNELTLKLSKKRTEETPTPGVYLIFSELCGLNGDSNTLSKSRLKRITLITDSQTERVPIQWFITPGVKRICLGHNDFYWLSKNWKNSDTKIRDVLENDNFEQLESRRSYIGATPPPDESLSTFLSSCNLHQNKSKWRGEIMYTKPHLIIPADINDNIYYLTSLVAGKKYCHTITELRDFIKSNPPITFFNVVIDTSECTNWFESKYQPEFNSLEISYGIQSNDTETCIIRTILPNLTVQNIGFLDCRLLDIDTLFTFTDKNNGPINCLSMTDELIITAMAIKEPHTLNTTTLLVYITIEETDDLVNALALFISNYCPNIDSLVLQYSPDDDDRDMSETHCPSGISVEGATIGMFEDTDEFLMKLQAALKHYKHVNLSPAIHYATEELLDEKVTLYSLTDTHLDALSDSSEAVLHPVKNIWELDHIDPNYKARGVVFTGKDYALEMHELYVADVTPSGGVSKAGRAFTFISPKPLRFIKIPVKQADYQDIETLTLSDDFCIGEQVVQPTKLNTQTPIKMPIKGLNFKLDTVYIPPHIQNTPGFKIQFFVDDKNRHYYTIQCSNPLPEFSIAITMKKRIGPPITHRLLNSPDLLHGPLNTFGDLASPPLTFPLLGEGIKTATMTFILGILKVLNDHLKTQGKQLCLLLKKPLSTSDLIQVVELICTGYFDNSIPEPYLESFKTELRKCGIHEMSIETLCGGILNAKTERCEIRAKSALLLLSFLGQTAYSVGNNYHEFLWVRNEEGELYEVNLGGGADGHINGPKQDRIIKRLRRRNKARKRRDKEREKVNLKQAAAYLMRTKTSTPLRPPKKASKQAQFLLDIYTPKEIKEKELKQIPSKSLILHADPSQLTTHLIQLYHTPKAASEVPNVIEIRTKDEFDRHQNRFGDTAVYIINWNNVHELDIAGLQEVLDTVADTPSIFGVLQSDSFTTLDPDFISRWKKYYTLIPEESRVDMDTEASPLPTPVKKSLDLGMGLNPSALTGRTYFCQKDNCLKYKKSQLVTLIEAEKPTKERPLIIELCNMPESCPDFEQLKSDQERYQAVWQNHLKVALEHISFVVRPDSRSTEKTPPVRQKRAAASLDQETEEIVFVSEADFHSFQVRTLPTKQGVKDVPSLPERLAKSNACIVFDPKIPPSIKTVMQDACDRHGVRYKEANKKGQKRKQLLTNNLTSETPSKKRLRLFFDNKCQIEQALHQIDTSPFHGEITQTELHKLRLRNTPLMDVLDTPGIDVDIIVPKTTPHTEQIAALQDGLAVISTSEIVTATANVHLQTLRLPVLPPPISINALDEKDTARFRDTVATGPLHILMGDPGTGKTHMITHCATGTIFYGEDQIPAFLDSEDEHASLIIDEFNMVDPAQYNPLIALVDGGSILSNDTLYDMTRPNQKSKKIFLAGNMPTQSLRTQTDIEHYGIIYHFERFSTEEMCGYLSTNNFIHVEELGAFTDILNQWRAQLKNYPFSLRDLFDVISIIQDDAFNSQMETVMTDKQIDAAFRHLFGGYLNIKETLPDVHSSIKAEVNRLCDDLQRHPTLAKHGIIFEGGSGIGKSHVIDAALQERGMTPIIIQLGDCTEGDLFDVINTAAKEGRPVIINEININTALVERVLDKCMSAVSKADQEKYKTLMIFGTQNPAHEFSNRDDLPESLLNRCRFYALPEINKQELKTIIAAKNPSLTDSDLETWSRAYFEAKIHNKHLTPRLFETDEFQIKIKKQTIMGHSVF